MKKHTTVFLFVVAFIAMLIIPAMAIDDYTGYFSEADLLAMTDDEKAEFLRVHGRPGGSIISVETLPNDTVLVNMQEADGTPGGSLYMLPPGSDDWMWEVADDVLYGDTRGLLEGLLATTYVMCEGEFLSTIPTTPIFYDWSSREPFEELMSRSDLLHVLEGYASDILNGKVADAFAMHDFKKLLKQQRVQELFFAETVEAESYPYLLGIYSNGTVPCALNDDSDYSEIIYRASGTIDTASGRRVTVLTANREWTEAEISREVAKGVRFGNELISNPSTIYNCHSYAWYLYSASNPYWINDISQFLLDNVCVEVNTSAVQIKDIIVYYDANDEFLHSGVVYGFDASGNILIQSKWGQGAVYRHVVDNVPDVYKCNGSVNVKYYRYHDYANRYTGSEYHSGSYHYYQYADFCTICNKQINTTWISVECSGPPCPTPWSLIDRRRVYAL